ncbi:MAG: 30S ribosomal protein S4, partial [candidate division NC10 bacterium]|nr:30S ribosomal protein S4 [candidate division NC10 bacterium]
MARYTDAVCKLCRREGIKLFLKGDRCHTTKCAIDKRGYAPGEHGQRRQRRVKRSDYGLQLREKQKMKRIYGVLEGQFRRYFQMATQQRGITGENLVRLLEQRLDNVVHRLGFGASRAAARLLVRHGHIQVNGQKVDIPSALVRVGDVVQVRPASRELTAIRQALESAKKRPAPAWLEVDPEGLKGTIRSLPTREDAGLPVEEHLIV